MSNCSYCLTRKTLTVALPCQHSFCPGCCLKMINVSQSKKGIELFTGLTQENEVLKCPRCAVCHVVSEVDKKMYNDVLQIIIAKETLRKKNEQKFLALYKASEPNKADGTTSFSLCQVCIPSLDRPTTPAAFNCITCSFVLMCEPCKIKHVTQQKRYH